MKQLFLITLVATVALVSLLMLWRLRRVYAGKLAQVKGLSPDIKTFVAKQDSSRWSFINSWTVVPQQDDRMPMRSNVVAVPACAGVNRSHARRRHQAMYKEWSQSRHD